MTEAEEALKEAVEVLRQIHSKFYLSNRAPRELERKIEEIIYRSEI